MDRQARRAFVFVLSDRGLYAYARQTALCSDDLSVVRRDGARPVFILQRLATARQKRRIFSGKRHAVFVFRFIVCSVGTFHDFRKKVCARHMLCHSSRRDSLPLCPVVFPVHGLSVRRLFHQSAGLFVFA